MIGADHGCRTFNDIITKYSIEKARDFTKEADPFHDAENNASLAYTWDDVSSTADLTKGIFAVISKIKEDL